MSNPSTDIDVVIAGRAGLADGRATGPGTDVPAAQNVLPERY